MGRRLRVISLFSGAGGLDYGFEAAGFSTSVAVEVDRDCCATLRVNRPRMAVVDRSIFDVSSDELLEIAGLDIGDADVVVGGPPCQPFSKSGYWVRGDSRRLDDPRAGTLSEYFRVVEDALPRVFLLENVKGLSVSGKNEALVWMRKRVDLINRRRGTSYDLRYEVLRSADFGVPQRRERLFFVAERTGRLLDFPRPTHGDPFREQLVLERLQPFRTAWDALADVKNDPEEDLTPRGRWADLLPTIPEGENYQWHTRRGGGRSLFGWRTRYWSFLLKLAKHLPSWTIQARPGPATGPFHWESRLLSRRELAALQTFPSNVAICGSRLSAQRQLGNAVPSLLAEILARAIRGQLLDRPAARAPLKLLPQDRGAPPPPEKARRVPRKYLDREGEHEDHPGPRRGPRAVALWPEAAE